MTDFLGLWESLIEKFQIAVLSRKFLKETFLYNQGMLVINKENCRIGLF